MNDRARAFFTQAHPDHSRIQYPEDVIFLCGGELGTTTRSVKSLRDYIFRNRETICENKTVVLAERAAQKFDAKLFDDLIEMERFIASISRALLLVCESAGSIAELGAFSQVEEIARKLQVFVHDDHYGANSFIRDGPLRYLDNLSDGAVQQFRWLKKSRSSIDIASADIISPSMTAAIKHFNRNQFRREAFKAARIGHNILLVAGVISYARCCKLREIVEYCKLFGVEMSQSDVQKYLFCLEIFQWVRSVKRESKYYHYVGAMEPFLFGGPGERGEFDPIRVRHLIVQDYEDGDPRLNVLTEILGS